jgi:hypothetical protein
VRLNKSVADYTEENGLYTLNTPLIGRANRAVAFPFGFAPTYHANRFDENAKPLLVKAPSTFFVGAYADLFGDWVPEEWIDDVFAVCNAAPQHTYLFLTKNPERYIRMEANGALRTTNNFWYGQTLPGAGQTQKTYYENTFLSIEPILSEFRDVLSLRFFKWVIIGALTGPGAEKRRPKREWVESIVEQCRESNIPVFMKSSLAEIWGADLIQEDPEGMPRGGKDLIPHCEECERHRAERFRTKDVLHFCNDEKIPGRYARTSPPWCPKRGVKA